MLHKLAVPRISKREKKDKVENKNVFCSRYTSEGVVGKRGRNTYQPHGGTCLTKSTRTALHLGECPHCKVWHEAATDGEI